MRQTTDSERLAELMRRLGQAAMRPVTVYLTGGATALLLGFRSSTIDVDLKVEPEDDVILRALVALKEALQVNIELAAPDQFIPALPGWRERSPFVAQEGPVTFRHYDLYAQALAKIERGHAQDRSDVRALLSSGAVDRGRLLEHFEAIAPQLYRFPALDEKTFRDALVRALAERPMGDG